MRSPRTLAVAVVGLVGARALAGGLPTGQLEETTVTARRIDLV
ncbi:MAG TPA: hypothetical protein VMT50_11785 [Steroidobacteraceae bacterium]|nr:hypothetical protein [Steroidobacteraceae bacterium]